MLQSRADAHGAETNIALPCFVLLREGVLEHGVELLSKPFAAETLCGRVRAVLDRPSEGGH